MGHSVCLNEEEFWQRLERRVTAEFAGFAERPLRYLWCDGFVPVDYLLAGDAPSIAGTAWIGDRQEVWAFTLLLARPITDRASFDWSALLPDDAATGWLAPDSARRVLIIEPAAAVPDDA